MQGGMKKGESKGKKQYKEQKVGRMRLSERGKKNLEIHSRTERVILAMGESEDKYFFSLPFCRLLGRAAPLIVPVWQYHFVLNLSFSLYLQVNVEK